MAFALIIRIIIGAVVGILINYISDVLPRTRRLSKPICSQCKNIFSLRDYLFSFTCKKCGAKPKIRQLLVTSICIILSSLLVYFPFGELNYWMTIPLMLFLGVVAVIDIEHHAVLIETSIFGLFLMFIYGIVYQGFIVTIVGGISGALIMFLLYLFGIYFNKFLSKIRKVDIEEVALGFGDIYVSAFLGLLTGWPTILGTIILAILLSGAYSLLYLLIQAIRKEYKAYSAIPYAPFLILGAIATFYIR